MSLNPEDPRFEVATVKKIIARKTDGEEGKKNYRVTYLVQWEGDLKDTWEPIEHLEGASDLVQRFERMLKEKEAALAEY